MKKFLLIALFVSSLFAHKLNLFVFEEDGKVIASTYFASGTFCNECKIEVYDKDNKLLEKGLTNKDGDYIVKNVESKLLIKAEAMGGHGAQSEFEVKNLATHKEEVHNYNLVEAAVGIILIFLIFLGLKRFQK
ncbi:hypothetical protein CRV08_02155 [Halarcobacter ebronensis]|uniref:Cobalt ABC transporter permease n=1 Tax=Halarcobacter ebronensis TaxID=1462615 RepID=A0A4Q0YK31_9BACT|nr:hypothetical protein [Halarcobacter ebronensis]RXJ69529.1 hypothetical protein CRV08_02155 [Halarcobacter ebronensis]